ncbi:MAG: TetR/AcrR family transcriptional regulator [Myxococcota bacterium]|nr:TetR/AcrR family transcriptional regulator [Myxococcota bacterium]
MARKLTPRKRPSQERARATVEALLQAAAQVLEAEGEEGLNTNKIAERAGVSIGTLYQYFPNKESLLMGLIAAHQEGLRLAIVGELRKHQTLPLPQLVTQVMSSMLDVFRANVKLSVNLEKLCATLGEAAGLEVELEALRVWTQQVLEERAAELAIPDPELAAFMVVRSVEGVVLGAARCRPELFENDALVPQLSALVLGYLAPERAVAAPVKRLKSAG